MGWAICPRVWRDRRGASCVYRDTVCYERNHFTSPCLPVMDGTCHLQRRAQGHQSSVIASVASVSLCVCVCVLRAYGWCAAPQKITQKTAHSKKNPHIITVHTTIESDLSGARTITRTSTCGGSVTHKADLARHIWSHCRRVDFTLPFHFKNERPVQKSQLIPHTAAAPGGLDKLMWPPREKRLLNNRTKKKNSEWYEGSSRVFKQLIC